LVAVGARIALSWGLSTPWIAATSALRAPRRGLLRLFGPDEARVATLLVQTAVWCSTGIVMYLWARQVASARRSLGVAGAVLVLPALYYSAFLMTESVSLLAVTSALFLLWRSFAHPS
jgi:hypothetical protein